MCSRCAASVNSSTVGIRSITKAQTHHALGAFDAVGLGAAMGEIGDDGGIRNEFTAHRRALSIVENLGVGAVAEVVLPRRTRQRIQADRQSHGRSTELSTGVRSCAP